MVNKSLAEVHPTDNICRIFRPNSKAHFNQPSTVNWYYCFSYMSKWPILQQTLKNSEGATNDGACRGRVQGRGPLHEVRRWYIYQHQARDMHNHSNSSVETTVKYYKLMKTKSNPGDPCWNPSLFTFSGIMTTNININSCQAAESRNPG